VAPEYFNRLLAATIESLPGAISTLEPRAHEDHYRTVSDFSAGLEELTG
jgi:hypothetical protein